MKEEEGRNINGGRGRVLTNRRLVGGGRREWGKERGSNNNLVRPY